MSTVHLALGSNVGDGPATLAAAVDALGALPGTAVRDRSGLYRTRPVGGPEGQDEYCNSVCVVETELSPRNMLDAIHRIEAALGRDRTREERWGPRTIDIDILLWDNAVVDEPDLVIPHPRMAERGFVLAPLAEVAPDLVHPVSGKRVRDLLERIDLEHEGIQRLPL